MNLKLYSLLKSPWVFHLSTGSCNNCDIEILDLITPRYDAERFGIQLVGSPRHADVLLVTGTMNRKSEPIVKKIYNQMAKPCLVIAFGACGCTQGIFEGSYAISTPVDTVIPVDIYIPGCPPRPEAILAGIVKLIGAVKEKMG